MYIFVQGNSEIKRSAVRMAFPGMTVKSRSAFFEPVNEQPCGLEETLEGARRRARCIYFENKPFGDLFVGIENGILRAGGLTFDLAAVVIKNKSGHELCSLSQGIMFPDWAAEEAKDCGFDTRTVGSVIAIEHDCSSTDPHFHLLREYSSRLNLLTQAVQTCWMQSTTFFEPMGDGIFA